MHRPLLALLRRVLIKMPEIAQAFIASEAHQGKDMTLAK